MTICFPFDSLQIAKLSCSWFDIFHILHMHQQNNSWFRTFLIRELISFNGILSNSYFNQNQQEQMERRRRKEKKTPKMNSKATRVKRIAHHLNRRLFWWKSSHRLCRLVEWFGIKQITACYFICFLIGHKTTLTHTSNEAKNKKKKQIYFGVSFYMPNVDWIASHVYHLISSSIYSIPT